MGNLELMVALGTTHTEPKQAITKTQKTHKKPHRTLEWWATRPHLKPGVGQGARKWHPPDCSYRQDVVDTITRIQKQKTKQKRHQPSYRQLSVEMNGTSFVCLSRSRFHNLELRTSRQITIVQNVQQYPYYFTAEVNSRDTDNNWWTSQEQMTTDMLHLS